VVGPEARGSACLGLRGEERRACIEVFEVLHYDGGFVRGPCGAVAQGRNEAARVDVEERLRFLVGIDFDVLVGDVLVLEGDPYALDEGTVGVGLVVVKRK